MRILTGIQPSGALHLGNYFGAMKPAIELQQQGEAFYFIADYHSMTSLTDAALRRQYTFDVASTSWPADSIRSAASSGARATCPASRNWPGS